MPKKKGHKKSIPKDFTLNDCANAPKPVGRVKKSTASEAALADIPWDQVPEDAYDNFDIVEETHDDEAKKFIYRKNRNNSKSDRNYFDDLAGIDYPEIVWHLISKFIKPEDVGHFAGINKATYAITGKKSFWRRIYMQYCENSPKLPERLKIDNSFRIYGLRQRVIRALYHTYEVFIQKVFQQSVHDCKPHELVRRRCASVWFCKKGSHWSMYFKLKKLNPMENYPHVDILKELGRIDANPEEFSQVLEVTCQNFNSIPPLMGMTLSSVSVLLSQGFRDHRMYLGFNTGRYAVSKNIQPENTVVLDSVKNIMVFDWWHPKYPHFDTSLPWNLYDEEALPILKPDFFC